MQNHELVQQLAAFKEVAHHFAIDFSMVRRELKALEECCQKFKQEHRNPIESLRRVNNFAVSKDRLWREMKVELSTAQAEITHHLHDQLSRAPAICDRAFTFKYDVGALSLRDHLLAAPDTNLACLDLSLFSLGVTAFLQVNTYGHDDMPDTFTDVPPAAT